jgi:hypothetical protein
MPHAEIFKLVIGYTLVGALVFTVVATCLSLVGWVKFEHAAQQKKLFAVLIVELVGGSVSWFTGALRLDGGGVADEIAESGERSGEERERQRILGAALPQLATLDPGQFQGYLQALHVDPASERGREAVALHGEIRTQVLAAPAGAVTLSPDVLRRVGEISTRPVMALDRARLEPQR